MPKQATETLVVERGVPVDPEPIPPPEWELAAKHETAAGNLMHGTHDLVGQFFLSLAVAFNDLKGLVMFEQYVVAMGRPPTEDFSPHAGQWRGVNVQLHRWIGGVLHEIMNVIGAKRFRSVRGGQTLQQLVDDLPDENRASWNNLLAVAAGAANGARMSELLHAIRNTTAFHYGHKTTELSDSYLEYFGPLAARDPNVANSAAQFSLGVDMDGTRFFYADAAAQHAMNMALGRAGATLQDIYDLAEDVNNALAALIGRFVRSRTG